VKTHELNSMEQRLTRFNFPVRFNKAISTSRVVLLWK